MPGLITRNEKLHIITMQDSYQYGKIVVKDYVEQVNGFTSILKAGTKSLDLAEQYFISDTDAYNRFEIMIGALSSQIQQIGGKLKVKGHPVQIPDWKYFAEKAKELAVLEANHSESFDKAQESYATELYSAMCEAYIANTNTAQKYNEPFNKTQNADAVISNYTNNKSKIK
ncbi:MAG: hypothetical protein MJ228_04210 [Bacilli bacterium]|nr:hypothetical protein [Bacilli bacterium]